MFFVSLCIIRRDLTGFRAHCLAPAAEHKLREMGLRLSSSPRSPWSLEPFSINILMNLNEMNKHRYNLNTDTIPKGCGSLLATSGIMVPLLEREGGRVAREALPSPCLVFIFEGFLTVKSHLHFISLYCLVHF